VKRPRHLPSAQWPEQDRQAWEVAMRPAGLFDDAGAVAHWRASTRAHVARHYGYWLTYCRQTNIALDAPIAARVTPGHVQGYLAHLEATVSINTAALYLSRLWWAVRAMAPDGDWDWLQALAQRVERRIQGPVVDKRPCLRDAGVLVELGLTLMAEVDIDALVDLPGKALVRARCQYRDGLLIALLASRPLRKGTLAQIRIGRELQQIGGEWHLVFHGEQTKTGQPLEYAVPRRLYQALETYLSKVRPRFPHADSHDALWASNEGCPMTASGITKCIRRWTEQRLGVAISPHRFRDCAASTLANRAPKQVRVAAALLGHTNLETTERYYIQADNLEAGRQYQSVVTALSHRGRKR